LIPYERVFALQGGPTKVVTTVLLLVTFECYDVIR